jgi:hypothetical protein
LSSLLLHYYYIPSLCSAPFYEIAKKNWIYKSQICLKLFVLFFLGQLAWDHALKKIFREKMHSHTLLCRLPNGATEILSTQSEATILHLKAQLEERCGLWANELRIVSAGRERAMHERCGDVFGELATVDVRIRGRGGGERNLQMDNEFAFCFLFEPEA